MNLFHFLKPPLPISEIEDKDVIKKQYKYWRLRIFYTIYLGYIFYYFSRKSFTFATPYLISDLGFDKSDLGLLGSILAITYGLSKFLSGVVSDRSNPRFFMAIGLILTGIFNILFGLSSSILFFMLFWGLNGWFQGWGWPPCARLLTYWYSQKERGTWWGFWNTSHSIGGAIIPLIAGYAAYHWGWRYAFYIPGLLCIGAGLFLINRLRDTPESLGLPSIEKFRNDFPTAEREPEDTPISTKQVLFEYVLNNKVIWVLAMAYFFVYILRTAISDWSVLYLVEEKGYSVLKAGACVCWFEIGGILGSLAAGWTSDRFFQGRRGPINTLFSLGVVFVLCALWLTSSTSPIFMSFLMFLIGFLIFGPQMLIGIAAAELSHKNAAGTATGFIGFVAYLGSAMAGYPLGKMTHILGWHGFFVILAACSLTAVLLLLPLWKIKSTHTHFIPQEPVKEQEEEVPLPPISETVVDG
jgi:MFS transporter, OPA family, sugar phosphate sensor protein UhpC